MPRTRPMTLSGWGNVPRQETDVFRATRTAEARAALLEPAVPHLIARGLGRSYGDAAMDEGGGTLLDTGMNRFLSFNPETGNLECEAGVGFEDIIATFLPRGFFLPVTPGTKYITLGGAIAADVHGKNHHRDGSIAEFIQGFDLLTGTGELLHCSRESNPDAFWATLGGMGLTGIIVRATLRLRKVETAYINVDYHKAANLEQALELFATGDEQYQYSVAWIDCLGTGAKLGRAVLIRGNHTPLADLPQEFRDHPLEPRLKRKKNVPFNLPGFALSPLTVRIFNSRHYRRHAVGRHVVDYDEFFYPLDSIRHWNRIYGKRGFFQYQAVFPAAQGRGCLVELMEKLTASRRASFLAVLKTMGKSSGGLLSFPTPGQTLALDLPNTGPETITFLRELDEIVLRFSGRVYLAKDAAMKRETFHAMYPSAARFAEVKRSLDPAGRLSSSQSRRLGIGEGA